MKKALALLAVCAIAPLALVACGGGDDESASSTPSTTPAETSAGGGGGGGGGGAGGTVSLAADEGGALAYDTDSLSTKAGPVTIEFDNQSSQQHDVCLKDSSGADVGCSDVIMGDSTTFDAGELEAGDYTFYCSVDAHEAAGMTGTLTVE